MTMTYQIKERITPKVFLYQELKFILGFYVFESPLNNYSI